MNRTYTPSPIVTMGHPIYTRIVPYSVACLLGTLITDIAYWRTANFMWANFSAWLLTAGLVAGGVAVLAGLVDLFRGSRVREQAPAWPQVGGTLLALVLSLLNAFVHSRDGWTSIVPTGLILSVMVVLILVVASLLGWAMARRHRVRVSL